jgi:hypothetical protein
MWQLAMQHSHDEEAYGEQMGEAMKTKMHQSLMLHVWMQYQTNIAKVGLRRRWIV